MNAAAVIHARGGSKRVPLKNIKPLGGKPLIAWCVEAALSCRGLSRVLVSTDHDGIADAARAAGAEAPFRRPADLAEDVASELVTRHALDFHERETGEELDVVVTIQPTTPFIQGADIDACLTALETNPDFDSAMSVAPVHERPEWMFECGDGGALNHWLRSEIRGDVGVSQTLPPLYAPNGGIYATRRSTLIEQDRLIGDACFGHVMSRMRSVDIDEPIDFLIAEAVAAELMSGDAQPAVTGEDG